MFQETSRQMDEDYIVVRGLIPGEIYEFRVVAVDGEFQTESEPEEIDTYTSGKCFSDKAFSNLVVKFPYLSDKGSVLEK